MMSVYDGSLLRQQPRAITIGHSPSTHQTQFRVEATLSSSSCDSPEVAHILKGVGVVDGDGVAIHRRKVVPTMAEAALLAGLHAELLDQPVSMLPMR